MRQSISSQSHLTIGRLARAASVNVETIRYYQRIGLVNEPTKPVQGFRKYSADTIEQIKFIKRAQQLGFSLKEIAELLVLGKGHCSDVRKRAEAKRDKINSQIKDLEALRSTLNTLIKACHSGKGKHECPIVETLSEKEINIK
jgi:MerR family mercuric resistance operon transcriptional regulator